MRFDLSALSDVPDVGWSRVGRILGVAFIVVFAGLGLGVVIFNGLFSTSSWGPGPWAALGFSAFFLGAGMFVAMVSRVCASSLEIDAAGFTFFYGRNSVWRERWDDPALDMTIGYSGRGSGNNLRILAVGRFYQRAYLTSEAFEAFIREARRHPLKFTESHPRSSSSTMVLITAT